MSTQDTTSTPTAGYRYWLYDPEGNGMTYYLSKEARDAEASAAIDAYLEDGWREDVEFVAAGEVTHSAQMLDKQRRPDDLDGEGCDPDGVDWGEFTYMGRYTLEPLAQPQPD